jgi:hypothetical protein
MMKSAKQMVPGIVTLALCGTAAAHNISADGWVGADAPNGTGTSVTINPSVAPNGTSVVLPEKISLAGITSLSFSPGTEFSTYEVLTRATLINNPDYATADEWEWFSGQSLNDYGVAEAVSLTATSLNGAPMLRNAPELTVSVGYGDEDHPKGQNCSLYYAGENASVTVNGNTYTAKNACALTGSGDLVFVNGVLKAGTGVGWTLTSTARAPELESASAAGGLTLLLGGLLVLGGRRGASVGYPEQRTTLHSGGCI